LPRQVSDGTPAAAGVPEPDAATGHHDDDDDAGPGR
jgi:hypothetical protein